MNNIKGKALTELKAFLDRSGEELNTFIAKIQVFENVLTVDFEAGTEVATNEVSVALLAKTPQGIQVAYNNVIPYDASLSEEEIFTIITNAFPTKEEIDAAREKAAAEAEARKGFEEQMQGLDPQALAAMAQNITELDEEVATETK